MCDKKNNVLFTDTGCFVLSSDFKLANESHVLLKVSRKNNMYSVDMKNIVPKESLTCLVAKAILDESMLGHMRLDHVNFKSINKLVKENLVRGLPTKRFENDQTCVACLEGKQHKASCKSKIQNSITQPLFMLHMDLFGPTFMSSLMNKKYCLVVTDDYSRFTWVFFLATKDETSGILKSFITEVENLVDTKVKIIRCDNGTEFKNRVMSEFCEKKGIKKEFSVARTPQQNGVAERRNRTLIEAARTMLADSKLPTTFWAEAVNTACYVQNRVLVVKPHNKTPYELFRGRTPALSFMRPFGCHVTILNTLDYLGKLDGKSDEGFFVGYSMNCDNRDLSSEAKEDGIFISQDKYVADILRNDYARASLDRKSTIGGCQFLGYRLISWQCRKQTVVATSTTKVEYVAVASCCGQRFMHKCMLEWNGNSSNVKFKAQLFSEGSTHQLKLSLINTHSAPYKSYIPPFSLTFWRTTRQGIYGFLNQISYSDTGSGNIDKTPTIPMIPPLKEVNTLGSDEGISTTEKDVSTVELVSTAGAIVTTDSVATKTKLQQEQKRLGFEAAVRLQAELKEEERQRIARCIQSMMIIVPEQGMNVEALQTKYPIIDWEIYTEALGILNVVLKSSELEIILSLVKEKFNSIEPTDDKEREIWVELKRLFEPDTDDELWKLQNHIHNLTWKH
ncbi:putative ribonuclease H-like domain-containing protein [Tanacetum coccineum]